jgi:sec-independent protein translocase protein TatB
MFKDVESSLNQTVQEAQLNLSDQADSSAYVTNFSNNMSLDEAAVYRESLRQGRDSWRVKRGNRPSWFKHSSGTRTRVQSGAARMKRYRHTSSMK